PGGLPRSARRLPARVPLDASGRHPVPRHERCDGRPARVERDRDRAALRGRLQAREVRGHAALAHGTLDGRHRCPARRPDDRSGRMRAPALVAALLVAGAAGMAAQEAASPAPAAAKAWAFNASLYGYFPPEDVHYAQPTVTADHGALHLEARYNY